MAPSGHGSEFTQPSLHVSSTVRQYRASEPKFQLTSVDVERVKVHSLIGGLAVGQLLFPIRTAALGQVLNVEVQELVGVGASVTEIKRLKLRKLIYRVAHPIIHSGFSA